MPKFALLACLAFSSLSAFSCAKLKGDETVKVSQLVVPPDEATPEERAMLDKTLTEIEKLTGEVGRAQSFRALPVLVTTESPKETLRYAACYSEEGRGRFITVNRFVLEKEKYFAAGSEESTLFQVLLHEIGHCYFGRTHDDTQISLHKLRAVLKEGNVERGLALRSLNSSAMHSKNLMVISHLKRYYVAEIIGLVPAPDLPAVSRYTNYTFVERNPE